MDERNVAVAAETKISPLKMAGAFFERHRWILPTLATVLLLFMSVWVLTYYITGPALQYFHADCADSLIWAQVTVETGEVLSEDFSYAALLPFGASVWMVPVLKICGFTMQAQIISMVIFALVFVGAAVFMFRSLKWGYIESALATFVLSMLLSTSVKLREIMWEHVIYYSLGILFTMLLLGLALRFAEALQGVKTAGKRQIVMLAVYGVLLLLLSVGCATDGMQMVVISVVPVAAAMLAYTLFDGEHKLNSAPAIDHGITALLMVLGTGMGLMLLNVFTKDGAIVAGYENAYSTWAPIEEWWTNAESFIRSYFSLMGAAPVPSAPLINKDSVPLLLKGAAAAVVLVCPVLLLASYKTLRSKYEKIVAWVWLVVSAAIMFGFICGRLSAANWRLTPMLGVSIIATAVYVRHLLEGGVVCRRVSALLLAGLLCVSMLTAKEIIDMPRDEWKKDSLQTVADTLTEKGYTYGYATFWNSAETALRSDGSVKVVNIEVQNFEIRRREYQTMKQWFEGRPGQENYFVLLNEAEFMSLIDQPYWQELCERCTVVEQFTCEEFFITVFEKNIF